MFSVWFREHLRHLHLRARCFCIAPIHPPSFWSQPRARQRVCEIRRCHLDNPFSFESRLACCFGSNQSTHEWRYRRQDFTFARSKKESRICSGSCLGQELKPKNQKTIFPKRILFGKMVFWFSLVFLFFWFFHCFFWFFQLPDLKKQKKQGKRWFLQQNYSKSKKNSREKMVFVRTWINKWFKNQKKPGKKMVFLIAS